MHDPSTIVGNDGFFLREVKLVTDSEKESKKIIVLVRSKGCITNRVINEVERKKINNFLVEKNSIKPKLKITKFIIFFN